MSKKNLGNPQRRWNQIVINFLASFLKYVQLNTQVAVNEMNVQRNFEFKHDLTLWTPFQFEL